MLKTMRFCALAVEEIENPRPHYRVEVRGTIRAMPGSCDHTAGLLPEELVLTVRLPIDIGPDLNVIKDAACRRAVVLLDMLLKAQAGAPKPAPEPAPQLDRVDADA